MATINASSSADIIVPSNNGTTYRGLGGDDTYIISNAASGNITIVDTSGSNTIQLVDGLSIASSKFAADSVQLTLSNGAVLTVNGADKFSYEVGGNATSGVTGTSKDYAGLASDMGVPSLPTGSTITDGGSGTISGAAISTGSISYTLSAGSNSVSEGGDLTYTITASSAPTSDVTFTYNVTGDDKGGTVDEAGGDDVASLSGTVTLAAGSTSATFNVSADSDTVNEGLEGIKVTVFDSGLDSIGSHTALISNVASAVSNTVALATTADNVDSGSGDDVISALLQGDNAAGTTLQPGDVITGGSGSDTLKISVAGDQGTNGYTVTAFETIGVEEIQVNNFETNTGDTTFNLALASGLTTLSLGASSATGDTVFTAVPNIVALEVSSGGGNATVTYAAAASAGAADVQKITVNGVSDTGNTMTISTEGVETLDITSTGTKSTIRTLTSTSATSATISGDALLTIETALEGGIATVDASGSSGGVALTLARDAAKTLAVTGSSGNDTFTYADNNWNTLNTLDGGEGTDTIILADADDLTTLTAPGATSIEVLGASTADTSYYMYTYIPSVTSVASYMGGNNGATTTIFGGMPSTSTLTVAGDGTDADGAKIMLAQDTLDDTLNVTLGATALGAGLTVEEILASEVETMTIANGGGSTATIELLDAASLADLTLTGAKAVSLTMDAATVNVTSLDSTGLLALVMTNNTTTKAITIDAGAYSDTLYGGTKGDTINAGGGIDTIYGGGGADTINAGAGNDIIEGEAGIDVIDAGDGNDTILVEAAAAFVSLTTPESVDGGAGTDTLKFGDGTGTVAFTVAATDLHKVKGIEKIAMNDDANQSITLDNTFFEYGGISSIIVDDSNATGTFTVSGATLKAGHALDVRASGANVVNTLTGGAGDDKFTFDTTAATSLKATDTVAGKGGTDTLAVSLTANNLNSVTLTLVSNIEKITVAGSGALTANVTLADGNFVTQTVSGVLYQVDGIVDASGMVGSGAFTFSGANEDDSILNITGGRGGDSLTGGSKADTISGGFGNDTLIGGAGIDTLHGDAGNDTFTVATTTHFLALTSAETVEGGAGTDTLKFTAASTVIAADLGKINSVEVINLASTGADAITLSDTVFTANGSPVLSVFDGATGGTFTVTAGGLSASNAVYVTSLAATDATDSITTGAGNDIVTFGLLSSTFANGETFDTGDTINLGAGTDTINVYLDGGNAHSATYTNVSKIEAINYIDIANTQAVTATLNDANFQTVTGGTISAAGIAGVFTLDASAENDSALTITGGNGADSLIATDTATAGDTINGGLGADTIDGSLGGDTITGGAGADIFKYNVVADSKGSTPDTINDFVSGTDKFSIALNYSTTTAGVTVNANVTTAKAGLTAAQDSLTGERGQTVYDTDNSILYVNADANNLITSLDYKINVNAGSVAASTVASADFNYVITGGSGGDTITSGSGFDTISSGAGNDTVTGGDGGDQINLGTGTSTVKFTAVTDGDASVTLTDITAADDDFTGTVIATGTLANNNDYVDAFTTGTDLVKIGGTLKALLEASGAAAVTDGATNLTTLDYNATGIIMLDNADQGGALVLGADTSAAFGDISTIATKFNAEIIASNPAAGDEILFTIENNSGTQTGLYYLKFGSTNTSGQIANGDTIALLAVINDDDFVATTVTVTS